MPDRRSSSSVAGAGIGSRPWAALTQPEPIGRPEHWICSQSAPSRCKPSTTPTTSTMASIAPTSWNSTCSTEVPWILASTSASASNTLDARSTTPPGSAPSRTMRSTSDSPRCGWSRSVRRTRARVPPSPCCRAASASRLHPPTGSDRSPSLSCSTATPASSSAPSSMSPDAPLKQSTYTAQPIVVTSLQPARLNRTPVHSLRNVRVFSPYTRGAAAMTVDPIAPSTPTSNGHSPETGTWTAKRGLAQMLKGGVIMDVVTADQAKIAEDAGAVAVMALERVPADIRRDGGVARMSDPELIHQIIDAVTIPVMAKARIGHFVEAQILEALGVDYIDESEVLTPADEEHHVYKHPFKVPFVCGARDLGEALRRIGEGAAMIRSKGEAGTGDVVEAVRHIRAITSHIRRLGTLGDDELMHEAKQLGAPYELVKQVARDGRLPVVLFTAGGIATPADAALMMQLGSEGVFVGSGIFKSGDPARRAAAIVKATTHYQDASILADVSRGLGEPMVGISARTLTEASQLATRGW